LSIAFNDANYCQGNVLPAYATKIPITTNLSTIFLLAVLSLTWCLPTTSSFILTCQLLTCVL